MQDVERSQIFDQAIGQRTIELKPIAIGPHATMAKQVARILVREQVLTGGHGAGVEFGKCGLQSVIERIADLLVPEQRILAQHLGVGDRCFKIEATVRIDCQPGPRADFGEHGFDAALILIDRGAADLHLHHVVAAIDIAAHLRAQGTVVLAWIIVAASGVDEDARIGLAPVLLSEHPEQRLAGDLCRRIPDRHVERADGDRALTMPARLLVRHHRRPKLVRIKVVTGIIEHGTWIGLQDPVAKPLPNEPPLAIATVGIEAIADDAPPIPRHIRHHGHQAGGHLREIDISVADRRGDRLGYFTNINDAHVFSPWSARGA